MITSKDNSKVKHVIKLRKSQARKKEDLIIVEGKKEIDMALRSGLKMEQLFYAPEIASKNIFQNLKCSVDEVGRNVFEHLAIRENPDGFLALFTPKLFDFADLKISKSSLVLILDAIEKPGNLGAILRTCDAVQVDAVILTNPKTDIFNHNVVRNSLGAIFTNKIIITKDLKIALEWLRENNFKICTTTPKAQQLFTDCDFKSSIALVVGTEHEGVSDFWLKNADFKITIPMMGKIDSLNASVSAALVLYEVLRQRK